MSKFRWGLAGGTALATIIGLAAIPLAQAQSPQTRPNTVRLEKSPLSGGVLMARAIRSGRVQLRGEALGAPPPAGLSCKPRPCALPNVQASGNGGQPVDEDPLSIDPNNNKHLVSGGNDYNCGSSLRGFFASTDGGKTWIHKCGPVGPGTTGGFGDPAIAWDLNGNVFSAGIDGLSSGDTQISVSKSTDNGNTWGTPVAAAKATGLFMDKEWLEADTNPGSPHANALYVSVTQFSGNNSRIGVSHSTDGGNTWTLVNVGTQQIYPTSVDQFSDLAVGADGTVYAAWLRCPATGPAGDCGDTDAAMYMSKSTDGGNKFILLPIVAFAPFTDHCRTHRSASATFRSSQSITPRPAQTSAGCMSSIIPGPART